jgi:hypothetical protein
MEAVGLAASAAAAAAMAGWTAGAGAFTAGAVGRGVAAPHPDSVRIAKAKADLRALLYMGLS